MGLVVVSSTSSSAARSSLSLLGLWFNGPTYSMRACLVIQREGWKADGFHTVVERVPDDCERVIDGQIADEAEVQIR